MQHWKIACDRPPVGGGAGCADVSHVSEGDAGFGGSVITVIGACATSTAVTVFGLANSKVECRSFKLIYDLDLVTLVHWHFPHPDKPACRWYAVSAVRADIAFPDRRSAPAAR
jgi:hypothetical protein